MKAHNREMRTSVKMQDALVADYLARMSLGDLSAKYNVSHPVIHRLVIERGLPRRKRLWDAKEDALLWTDLPRTTISDITGRTIGAVTSRRYYLLHRKEPQPDTTEA